MPSAPFQSRVFRYLSQQRLRLQDQLQVLWRQAKITATWSAQVLLYPIYAAVQGTRLLAQQVGRTAQQVFPGLGAGDRIAPPTAILPTDTPIQNTLQGILDWATSNDSLAVLAQGKPAVKLEQPRLERLWGWLSGWRDRPPQKTSSPAALAPRQAAALQTVGTPNLQLAPVDLQQVSPVLVPAIASLQGIASCLIKRSLVLVGRGNVIYDVLSLEQQAALQHRMSWEMATYWRDRRQQVLASITARTRRFLPASETAQRNLLPPVRAFLGLMDWMQQGPVAIATNLFQEATLALYFGDLTPETLAGDQGNAPLFSFESLAIAPSQALPLHPTPTGTERSTPALLTAQSQRGRSPMVQTTPRGLVNPFDDPELLTTVTLAGQRISGTPPQARPLAGTAAELTVANATPSAQTAPLPPPAPYIETNATLIGYEQHPLERLLKWLDAGMLWLEKHWDLFWKWMMGRRR